MSKKTPSIEKLEKQLRVLNKKLERSEWHRVDLENQHDRDQHLYRRLHTDLDAARRETEIEAALARVRTQAMAMRTPEDLSGISEAVFTELKALGFAALRNTEIIINHDAQTYITSYYYSDYGVTGVIDVDYRTNPTVEAWAREMQEADDAFAEVVIPEEELADWRAYRLSLGYVPDPKLNDATAVYYYSYSIGLGALSISSFEPVPAEYLSVLAQFRNVFNLAYQRYVDIARAEAQAYEAQIQLALERVRAQSMLMQHSSELVTTSAVFHEQLLALGVATEFSYVWLPDEPAGQHQFWATWTEMRDGAPVHRSKAITYDLDKEEPYTAACFAAWASDDRIHIDFIPPAQVDPFFASWGELIGDARHMRPEHFPDGLYYAEAYMQYGCFGIDIRRKPTEAEQDILGRFAVEFERTYKRFLGLRRAEGQAREAEIEAALERVRSRTMAMHNPDELQEVVSVVAEELQRLEVIMDAGGVIICTYFPDSRDVVHWLSSPDFSISKPYLLPYFDHPIFNAAWESRERGDDFFSQAFSVEEKNSFFRHAFEHSDYALFPDDFKEWILSTEHHALTFAWSANSAVLIPSFTDIFPSEDDKAILKRFARVFEQAFIRFLDLQQAEAQAREAQIEAALERIRSRTMAMHQSDEIAEVAVVAFEQFKGLPFPSVRRISIGIIDTEANTMSFWASATTERESIRRVTVPLDENPAFVEMVARWQAGEPYFSLALEGEALHAFVAHISDHGWEYPAGEGPPERLLLNFAAYRYGLINASTYEVLDDESFGIIQRFARVFEQTYTRFLDLKKAEAQAREAQIEAALERVRARAMAMHSSNELLEVVFKIRHEYAGLGLPCDAFWHTTYTPDWYQKALTGIEGQKLAAVMELPRDFSSNPALAAWERGDEPIGVFMFDTEAACQYLHHMVTKGKFQEVDPEAITQEMIRENEGWTFVQARTSHGEIGYSLWGETAPSQEAKDVLLRFARTFDLAYRRFKDLQQAEVRAREAQIEASLERVRARAMAMHSSEDLSDATAIVFTELERLGISTLRCGIIIIHESMHMDTWTASETQEGRDLRVLGRIDMTIHPLLEGLFEVWKAGQSTYVYEMVGEDLHRYYEAIWNSPDYHLPRQRITSERQTLYAFNFSEGALFAFAEDPLETAWIQVFQRFARVFEQTYTRFLDLKKAEAQAREAQIEASLERVRARAMAMHSSDDLSDATAIVFTELERLGISTLRCGINIIHAEGTMDLWTATATEAESDIRVLGRLDTSMHPLLVGVHAAWQAQHPVFSYRLEGDDIQAYYQALKDAPSYDFPQDANPTGIHIAYAFIFAEGALFAFSEDPLPDESIQIFQRFAAVFALTYRRYLDLEQAEQQARQAQRRAAIDRVRAEIASMRTTEDLQRITPLIWRELTELNVPFFRCGVFIIDEATETVQVFLTTPMGKALAALTLGFKDAPVVRNTVANWRSGTIYKEEWDAGQMKAWTQFLQERGHIETATRYLNAEAPPEHLSLHFVPFAQGMLYVGSRGPLQHADLETVQALADAFSVAYARYEDFQQLEAKKREVEVALEELHRTQSQLVQQEKMASLGELTAGIAHEIKNPLNFINNFAELNAELAQELREALADGDDPAQIIDDMEQNATIIADHGKRADSIVKSMMAHARTGSHERKPVDFNELVHEHLDLAYHGKRATTPGYTVEIAHNLDEAIGEVNLVPQDIGRVVLNLLSNAFDAVTGVDGAQVRVTTHRSNGQVSIQVADNGPGITDEVRAKVFEPFFTTKPTGQGTGLGLSLSYDIVTHGHGGTMTVESEPGQGAVFVVVLPAT